MGLNYLDVITSTNKLKDIELTVGCKGTGMMKVVERFTEPGTQILEQNGEEVDKNKL